MLMRLQEALADVEQLKADLLNSEDSARQPGQPTTAPKKKRKAQSLIQHPALSHGPGRSSKLKAHVALTQGHGDSAGELHSCAFTPVGLHHVSRRSLCCLQARRVHDGQNKNCAAMPLLELCVLQDVCSACMSYTWWSHMSLKAEQTTSAGRSVSEQIASTGCSYCCSACSAGDALTQDKSSSTVLVHQPASRGESQAELDVDLSTRPEEHRAVPGSQIVSHKVQIRAVPSSPNVSQKRQMQPRRQQGPLPGAHLRKPFQHSAHIIDVLGQCSPY